VLCALSLTTHLRHTPLRVKLMMTMTSDNYDLIIVHIRNRSLVHLQLAVRFLSIGHVQDESSSPLPQNILSKSCLHSHESVCTSYSSLSPNTFTTSQSAILCRTAAVVKCICVAFTLAFSLTYAISCVLICIQIATLNQFSRGIRK
jgi:hypothetical protein